MPESHYILERLNWRRARGLWLCLPGADRLRSFGDRVDADGLCREMEWDIRRTVNPFACGGPFLHYQTAFDAARLFDWCLDAGLEPPGITNDSRIWADWWATHRDSMSDAQRATVWEALDRVRFYRVTESASSVLCQLVGEQHFEWEAYGWRRPHYGYIGSTPYMLTRTQETADDLCRQLYIDRLAREGAYVGQVTMPTSWAISEHDPFSEFDEQIRDIGVERRPLDLIADRPMRPGQEVFVVLRRHWMEEEVEGQFFRWSPTSARSCGRPIAAFNTLAAADECQARLEAEARRTPALFRFGPPHEWSTIHPSTLWGILSELAPIDFTSMWEDYKATDRIWCNWWDRTLPTLTLKQFEMVWSLYDKLKFYEIVAVEFRE